MENKLNKITTLISLIFRIIVLPIFFIFMLIAYFKSVFTTTFLFLFYGGEMVVFEKNTKKTIIDLIKTFAH